MFPESSNLASRYILLRECQHKHIRRQAEESTEQHTHYREKKKPRKIKVWNKIDKWIVEILLNNIPCRKKNQ